MSTYKIDNSIMTDKKYYKDTLGNKPKGIVIHYFGDLGTAKNVAKYFRDSTVDSSAHFTLDEQEPVYQVVDLKHGAWHCGRKNPVSPVTKPADELGNINTIGIEVRPGKLDGGKSKKSADKDWYFEQATYDRLLDFTSDLMIKYNIDIKYVVRHYDITGKACPRPFTGTDVNQYYGKTGETLWKEFLSSLEKMVAAKRNNNKPDTKPEAPLKGLPQQVLNTADTKRKLFDTLNSVLKNEFATAGVMGNIQAESNFNSANLQGAYEKKFNMTDSTYTAAVNDGSYNKDTFVHDSAGYGLAQWTYWSRKQNLYVYAAAYGTGIADTEMQIEYMIGELRSYGLISKLQACTSVKQASDIIITQYEKPADQSDTAKDKRASYGMQIYNEFCGNKQKEFKPGTKIKLNDSSAADYLAKQLLDMTFEVESQSNGILTLKAPNGLLISIDDVHEYTDKPTAVNYLVYIEKGVKYYNEPKDNAKVNGSIVTSTKYTIVQEQGTYGKLKSGVGWVKLSECKRV